ncbi:hypothetical protein SAMN05660909_01299 [Chitinophaga terrae (ex Kim and Jung 2007)]|uniref:Peptidase S74 domain-containing protein n=1 Tax=Chitinophaga terrae (ex Kim and Jung 2007) TaxID=408074 RepID=A0A1H3ZMM0_9BACT|nr:hypothetical protein [Chitinophaga terrae (ex Kim and Jung 2007)]GEP88827.1 hypothetical protein CTE07_04720 [Chitinophaga terrae (ex Kim and Jung 2007)]SEA24661.1 hypothetical protein SAMN05660909_01299 [Chitinophaga terrae (ex Kim and Jung 2007)]
MKSTLVTLLCLFVSAIATAQNTFPATGNVGIGTTSPTSRLQVVDNGRNYYVNRGIPGATDDNVSENYILLHPVYVAGASFMPDCHVMGKISAIRGSAASYNRKWTVEVNTASAYNSNIGNIISYNDSPVPKLVTLIYDSITYLAVSITKAATVTSFSFTGWAQNESFKIVKAAEVSDVKIFNASTEIGIQAPVGIRNVASNNVLTLAANDTSYSNFLFMTHTGFPQSMFYIGTTNSSYIVPAQRNASLIESYRDLHIGAANSGNIIFENGRNGTAINSSMVIANNKNVGIGIDNPTYKLTVNGTIGARRVKVTQETWADYVFHPNYQLPSLASVEQFIKTNKHLPDIPSEKEVTEKGIDLGEINKLYLQKIEELTLYIIDLQKQINALKENAATQAK